MNKLSAFWVGFSSIFALFPSTDHLKPSSPEELNRKVWDNVGASLGYTMSNYDKKEEDKEE